jgi:crotonobetainyl-CoA:carnitine CoA-transferase CaiB-like acyl-CoA transferase
MVTSPVDDIGIDKVINDPVNVEGIARIGVRKAPEMGEHTHPVLTELGYSATEIAALQTDGIIG